MTKESVIKEFTSLNGVGNAKAELIYTSGFNSIEKLKNATVEDLKNIKGITEKNAKDILNQLKETGITREDLYKISELTAEYDVDLYKVLVDTFGDREDIKQAIKDFLKEIEKLFKQYDEWKETDFAVF